METVDWTEIQTMICVARVGSLSAAARELAVNHSTVLRRIQAFESKHKVRVFRRDKQGYQLSSHGRSLLQSFEQIEQDMLSLQRRMTRYDSQIEGKLVITTTDSLFDHYFSKPIVDFSVMHPALTTDVLVSNALVDMDHLQADVALRPAASVPEGYRGQALFTLEFFFFATEAVSEQLDEKALFNCRRWLGFSGALASSRAGQELREKMQHPPVFSANAFPALAEAANAGLGLALLPSFIGDRQPLLRRVQTHALFATEIYFLATEELAGSAKVRSFQEYLTNRFKSLT